jgi:hypothetical protein
MHQPICTSLLALRDRVSVWLPGPACPLASPTCFLGTEEGSQVLIPVVAVSAAEGQISSQGTLSFAARSYCKGKMILCANEEVEHRFMPPTSSLAIRKPDCRDWSTMRAWRGLLGFMPECL